MKIYIVKVWGKPKIYKQRTFRKYDVMARSSTLESLQKAQLQRQEQKRQQTLPFQLLPGERAGNLRFIF